MQMAANKFYSYYLRGNQIALIEQDLDDNSRWKSPVSTVADALEIEYAYSPRFFIKETDDTNTALDTYKSTGGYLILEDTGNDNFSASPESLADGSYIVLRNAGRWNGLHRVSAAGAGYINTYTKYSGTGAAIAFEETVTLYYNVDVLNDELDTIDLPEYLAKALVYYVKAKMAEDQGDMERMQYNEVQFRALMNRYENSRIWGSRRIAPGIGAIR